jgi:hypothetical protein
MKRYFYNKHINKVGNLSAYHNGKAQKTLPVFNFRYNQYNIEILITESTINNFPVYGYISNETNTINFDFTDTHKLQVYSTYFNIPLTLYRMIYRKCMKLAEAVLQMQHCITQNCTGVLELKGNKLTVYPLADADVLSIAGGYHD